MCSYCGCRANTVIARYSAEHDDIVNAMGVLRRAASAADQGATAIAARDLVALLDPHTTSEESSLFAELRLDAEFTEHVDGLCAEHREIDGTLARVTAGDRRPWLCWRTSFGVTSTRRRTDCSPPLSSRSTVPRGNGS